MYKIFDLIAKAIIAAFDTRKEVLVWFARRDKDMKELNVTGKDLKYTFDPAVCGFYNPLRRYQVLDEENRSVDIRTWTPLKSEDLVPALPFCKRDTESGAKRNYRKSKGMAFRCQTLRASTRDLELGMDIVPVRSNLNVRVKTADNWDPKPRQWARHMPGCTRVTRGNVTVDDSMSDYAYITDEYTIDD